MTSPIITDRNLLRQIAFKYSALLKINKQEPELALDTALWAVNKLWEKEVKDEKELIG